MIRSEMTSSAFMGVESDANMADIWKKNIHLWGKRKSRTIKISNGWTSSLSTLPKLKVHHFLCSFFLSGFPWTTWKICFVKQQNRSTVVWVWVENDSSVSHCFRGNAKYKDAEIKTLLKKRLECNKHVPLWHQSHVAPLHLINQKFLSPGTVHKDTFGFCLSHMIMPVTDHRIWQPFHSSFERIQIRSLEEWGGIF